MEMTLDEYVSLPQYVDYAALDNIPLGVYRAKDGKPPYVMVIREDNKSRYESKQVTIVEELKGKINEPA